MDRFLLFWNFHTLDCWLSYTVASMTVGVKVIVLNMHSIAISTTSWMSIVHKQNSWVFVQASHALSLINFVLGKAWPYLFVEFSRYIDNCTKAILEPSGEETGSTNWSWCCSFPETWGQWALWSSWGLGASILWERWQAWCCLVSSRKTVSIHSQNTSERFLISSAASADTMKCVNQNMQWSAQLLYLRHTCTL